VGPSGGGLVSLFAPFCVEVAGRPELLAASPQLRASALSCLARLCALDAAFCEAQLGLLFTRLRDTPAASCRASLMVALGDLAFRFPNAVEPWTGEVYGSAASATCLHDPDAGVRKHSLTVLSHLVLNDMMKVKGHVADMARCLEDSEPGVRALARLFLFELSHRTGAPIYNLLPDLLSRLSADASLDGAAFSRVMRHLLAFIDKDKQTDALVDKLLARLPDVRGPPFAIRRRRVRCRWAGTQTPTRAPRRWRCPRAQTRRPRWRRP
jgi:condensin complex subunit 1